MNKQPSKGASARPGLIKASARTRQGVFIANKTSRKLWLGQGRELRIEQGIEHWG